MTKKIRSALPIYMAAAIWLVYGLIFPLYTLPHILCCAAVSVVAYIAGCYIFPARVVKIEKKITTGDPDLDKQLEASRALLMKLHAANDAIPDEAISAQLDRMEDVGLSILNRVAEQPGMANSVRRFMNYYLPTAEKLLSTYTRLSKAGISGEQIEGTMKSVENSLTMIVTAFEKQLDSLYKDENLDITTDIEVLETMMKADNLI